MIDRTVRSLSRQIILIVLAAQVICALALVLATLDHERRTRLHAFDVQLRGHSDSLLGAIQDEEDAQDHVFIDSRELVLPDSDLYAVYDEAANLIGHSPGADLEAIRLQVNGIRSARSGGRSYRTLQRPAVRIVDKDENSGQGIRRMVTIVYASPDGNIWHEVLEAASYSLLAILLAAACTVAIVLLLMRRALSPLTELAAEAEQISSTNLCFKTPASVQRVKELEPLAQVLTRTVSKLHRAFENEHRFFGDAAHELKTAIAVVRSSLQLLMLRERTAREYREGLERVLTDNDRVESLVAQMLRLTSIEGFHEDIGHSVDLSSAVAKVCETLQPIATLREVSVQTELKPDSTVRLSAERADMLISNLFINAVQHSRASGSVRIGVTKDAGRVLLTVSDYGHGISQEALPHIFERFYREDTSRSRATGGTGLGLSICKAIVSSAGGTIAVDSSVGVGTTFSATFMET